LGFILFAENSKKLAAKLEDAKTMLKIAALSF
jgi:hypothetical protein